MAHTAEGNYGLALALAVGAVTVLIATVVFEPAGPTELMAAALMAAAAAAYRPFVQWRHALAVLLAVILFIPIRRYALSGSLPFQLEPYRALLMLVVGAWFLALLADPRVRIRRSGFDGAMLLLLLAPIASVVVNGEPARVVQSHVLKSITFFVGFLLVFYLIVSVTRPAKDAAILVKTLVVGGAVLAALAVLEFRTGVNAFDRLASALPFLEESPVANDGAIRQGRFRAYASAQHPIALGAALVMLLPLALHLAWTRGKAWVLPVLLLGVGALATLARTSVVMLAVIGVVLAVLRPRQTLRLLPALIPLVVATHFFIPGTLGTLKQSFVPDALLAEQRWALASPSEFSPFWCNSSGRLSDLGPMLDQAMKKPVLGQGYGTRITGSEEGANACVLDNQWLGTLLETGIVGVSSWLLLFLFFVVRAGRQARTDSSDQGGLLAAIVASVAAFAVGMALYDTFAFIQVTFLMFILLAIGATLLRERGTPTLGGLPQPLPAERLAGP